MSHEMRLTLSHCALSVFVGFCCLGSAVVVRGEDNAATDHFEKKIRPILVEHCYECHSSATDDPKGGLRVDTREAMRSGGGSGPGIVPGDPDASLVIQAVRYAEDAYQMPPAGKLPDELIQELEQWVRDGAADPREEEPAAPAAAGETKPTAAEHWAFKPPQLRTPPEVQDTTWVRDDLDRFLLARLEQRGIVPSPTAPPEQLIRRVYFDVIGLPPTADQVAAFVADPSEAAYQRLVEDLLSTPQYGERWARHWLDVSRFGDTKGYVFMEDRNYPEAHTFRTWVIEAFNRDLPYNDFVRYQLAGEQLPELEGWPVSGQAAMGFLTLGRRFLNNRHDIIDDRIDVVTRGLLGLTVSCARCHDHKYDPIPTKDYYSLYGVFASSEEPKNEPSPLRLVDSPNPHDAHVLVRGSPGNLGDIVPRQFLEVLAGPQRQPFQQGSGRREMAEAIVSPDNPLTARVLVNRVWLQLFGEGLVSTPSDFGLRSDPPAQPEVLDELAMDFVADGWSVKRLIRRIVLSSAYRQTSTVRPEAAALDPENRLFWRQNRRRLDFEAIRDAVLAVSGQLDRTVGGPSVQLTEAPFPRRRTVYAFIDRQNLPGLFRTFDFASPDTHAPKRYETTTPQQSLFLLNSPFLLQEAVHVVQHAWAGDSNLSDVDRVQRLYRTVLSRNPTESELAAAQDFLAAGQSSDAVELAEASPWSYGYGRYDEAQNRVVDFHELPHFTGEVWQGGGTLPDASLGWVLLSRSGGHPGNTQFAAIRRWSAPQSASITLRGRLRHRSDQGDGVRGLVVSDRQGRLGEWIAQHGRERTVLENITVEAGETLYLVTECRTNESFDSFEWQVALSAMAPQPAGPAVQIGRWHSAEDFRGPVELLDVWHRLAQVLLLTNEFAHID